MTSFHKLGIDVSKKYKYRERQYSFLTENTMRSKWNSIIRIDNDALVVFSKKEEKYIVIKNCFRKLLAAGNR